MAIEGTDFAAHVLVPRASAKSVELARLQGEDFLHVLVEDLQRRLDVAFVFLGDLWARTGSA